MFWHHELTPKYLWLFQGTTNEKSLTCVFQWRVLTCILWSGSSPAVWWWWLVCPCRGEWTSITLRKVQRFATTATPTTSSPSDSIDRYGQRIYLEVKVLLLHWAVVPVSIYCSYFVSVKAIGGVSGGVCLYPQHQRYEATQDPAQHTHKPLRYDEKDFCV